MEGINHIYKRSLYVKANNIKMLETNKHYLLHSFEKKINIINQTLSLKSKSINNTDTLGSITEVNFLKF